ncbi:transposase [bacterium]|nr:transposase [bacterium]MBU1653219.1 transposase [bacterium]
MKTRKSPVHLSPRHPLDRPPIIFLTVCTDKRKPVLCRNVAHQLIVDTWQKADKWLVGRYVIMPDHLHLFCSPKDWNSYPLNRWVQYWKSHISRSWISLEEQPLWQRSFWDTQLRREESYLIKWQYIRLNPVRKNLCSDPQEWPYQGEINELVWFD